MKIPFSWLQSFFSSSLDVTEVERTLTNAGLEIESVTKPKPFGKYFVIGKVESVEKHPDADRLSVCTVKMKKKDVRTIVCGAPNVRPGQHVAVVLPGGLLPNGTEIKETSIRGVASSGMICAEDELGISENHDGILVLDESTTPGARLDTAGLNDIVLDAEITANRPDWLSIYGVAREYGALKNVKVNAPIYPIHEKSILGHDYKITVAKNAASVYMLRYIEKIQMRDTPHWMRQRLIHVGVETHNVVVDITNYVLYEFGQPLHAFDADAISGKIIRVRFAKAKEKITLLDGRVCTLTPDDIVIADSSGPIALAGIMGGEKTAVTQKTKGVVLESALFPSHIIRKTAKRLGIISDAANRFERGVPAYFTVSALEAASSLLEQYGQARVAKTIAGTRPKQIKIRPIIVSVQAVNNLLGTSLSSEQMKKYLSRLDFSVLSRGKTLRVSPPAYRSDITIEADVAEEVARMHGYHKLQPTLPAIVQKTPHTDDLISFMNDIRVHAVRRGYTEVVMPSFYGSSDRAHGTLPADEYRMLENPIDSQAAYLRSDLLPLLIRATEQNRKTYPLVKMFEIGQVFSRHIKPGSHEWRIAYSVSDQNGGSLITLQSDIVSFVSRILHVPVERIHFGNGKHFMDIKIDTTPVGYMTLKQMKKGMVVAVCECSVQDMLSLQEKETYVQLKKFPAVHRDLAIVVPLATDFVTLIRQIQRASSLVVTTSLFDAHPQSDTSISYAFHITFQSHDRTLSAKDIELELTSIERALQQKGGTIRS